MCTRLKLFTRWAWRALFCRSRLRPHRPSTHWVTFQGCTHCYQWQKWNRCAKMYFRVVSTGKVAVSQAATLLVSFGVTNHMILCDHSCELVQWRPFNMNTVPLVSWRNAELCSHSFDTPKPFRISLKCAVSEQMISSVLKKAIVVNISSRSRGNWTTDTSAVGKTVCFQEISAFWLKAKRLIMQHLCVWTPSWNPPSTFAVLKTSSEWSSRSGSFGNSLWPEDSADSLSASLALCLECQVEFPINRPTAQPTQTRFVWPVVAVGLVHRRMKNIQNDTASGWHVQIDQKMTGRRLCLEEIFPLVVPLFSFIYLPQNNRLARSLGLGSQQRIVTIWVRGLSECFQHGRQCFQFHPHFQKKKPDETCTNRGFCCGTKQHMWSRIWLWFIPQHQSCFPSAWPQSSGSGFLPIWSLKMGTDPASVAIQKLTPVSHSGRW